MRKKILQANDGNQKKKKKKQTRQEGEQKDTSRKTQKQ